MYDYLKNACLLAVSLLVLVGCNDWVQNVEDPIDSVPSDALNSPERISFLTNGVRGLFAETHDQITVTAGGLSDEQVFDRDLPQATFPSFDRLERGDLNLDDPTVNNELGEFRLHADDLVRRVTEMDVPSEFSEDAREALFYGKFLGGVARAWYASYLGLEPEEGGGVIDNGPFIPSSDMYTRALDKMSASLKHATPRETKVVNSTMARVRLYRGDLADAISHAEKGLTRGDDPFVSKHSTQSVNNWYNAAGEGRTQWRVNTRFTEYIEENPTEANRIHLTEIEGRTQTWNRQGMYTERGTPIVFVDWQETYLIMAEAGLRTGDSSVDPLSLVNEVRDSHGLSPLSSVDMDVILEERDKELFTRGQRMIDQRRYDMWHLDPSEEQIGPWKYFPISQQERNENENF
jgi:hypothetical protein